MAYSTLILGDLKNEVTPMYRDRDVKWSQKGVKVLGIQITHDQSDLINSNFNPVIDKMENIIKIWLMRDFKTLYGKATIVKTFIQSQLVYQLSVLPSPSKTFFKKVETIIFKYLYGIRNQTK